MRKATFRTASNMSAPEKGAQVAIPHRQATDSSHLSDEAVPVTDPRDVSATHNSTVELACHIFC